MSNILELHHLKKYYATQKAVDDISFDIKKGSIFYHIFFQTIQSRDHNLIIHIRDEMCGATRPAAERTWGLIFGYRTIASLSRRTRFGWFRSFHRHHWNKFHVNSVKYVFLDILFWRPAAVARRLEVVSVHFIYNLYWVFVQFIDNLFKNKHNYSRRRRKSSRRRRPWAQTY